jgi:Uma2 family endonuclease
MHLTPSPASPAAYPSGDGRPLAETPVHRRNLVTLIDVLDRRYADDPLVYVSGNMFVYYEPGNRRKHVAPDVFFVRGVPKDKRRDYYLVWDERAPDLVVELTSASTADEDLIEKKLLYQNVLGVREYVLFDPRGEYLHPRLQGFRLEQGEYVSIAPVAGRIPSLVIGLQFEAQGEDVRLYDPLSGRWLPTADELLAEASQQLTETSGRLTETSERLTETSERLTETSERLTEVSAENERLQRELAELRRQLGRGG